MNKTSSWFCKIFLKPIVDKFLIKKVKGLENAPREGNFILVANHQSHLDHIATAYICIPRRFHMIGQVDRYNTGLVRVFRDLIYFITGVIPLNREIEESKKKAIEEAIKILKMGDILIIYPEGTRSRTGQIQEGKCGVAKIFLKTGIPILPVGIKSAFELLPPGRNFPKIKRSIEVNIGKPLYFKEEFKEVKNLNESSEEYREILQKITKKIMEEITNLIS